MIDLYMIVYWPMTPCSVDILSSGLEEHVLLDIKKKGYNITY